MASEVKTIAGLKTTYVQKKAGAGAAVSAGNTVTVHATGVVVVRCQCKLVVSRCW